jgi:hypothetical protein
MAKKAAGAKMSPTETPTRKRIGKAVRLDLNAKDHARLERLATRKGLTMSSYVRLALFERMADDERSEGR